MGRGLFEVVGRAWARAEEGKEGRFLGSGGVGVGDDGVFVGRRRWSWGFWEMGRGGLIIWGVSGSVGVGFLWLGSASTHGCVCREKEMVVWVEMG